MKSQALNRLPGIFRENGMGIRRDSCFHGPFID
jgi:hypothetical protein